MLAYIIRHGETEANARGLLQGQTDTGLLESGRTLAREVGLALSGTKFDVAFSSPLRRATETARLVLDGSGNADVPLTLDDRLLEIDMGEWEGLRFLPGEREVDAEGSRLFFEEPFRFEGFPGGEDAREVCARTQSFLASLADLEYNSVLVSTHGFALRAMLNRLYDDPSDFWQGGVPLNCAVSVVEIDGDHMSFVARDLVLYDESLCVDRYASY